MVKSSASKIRLGEVDQSLNSYDSLFESTSPDYNGKPVELRLDSLHPFPDHPFKMYNEVRMAEMVESVKSHGVIMPILVRPKDDGSYEIIAGHNRVEAARLAGLPKIPSTIREMDDDTAVILMVDSNIRQREQLLPSEKARAYKMKLDAIKRQGERTDLTSAQVVPKLKDKPAREIVADEAGENRMQISRYIRLNYLIEPLLDRVDNNKMAFGPAVAISYLLEEQQNALFEFMELEECSPSLEQAESLKEKSQAGELTFEDIYKIMRQDKANQKIKYSIPNERIEKYIPRDATPQQVQDIIVEALEMRQKHLERKQQMRDAR